MKKMILGVGLAICGLMLVCTEFITRNILDAMPGVSLVGSPALSLTWIGWILVVAGIVTAVFGCSEQ